MQLCVLEGGHLGVAPFGVFEIFSTLQLLSNWLRIARSPGSAVSASCLAENFDAQTHIRFFGDVTGI
jgi:hypothetical protein